MTIIGFDFTKMQIERRKIIKGKINIANNISVKNVEDVKISLGPDKMGVKFTFQFTTKYEPDIGDILIEGEVLYLASEEEGKTILLGWKKDKKLPKDVRIPLLNHVLSKSNIAAILLSREMNLPAPVMLPRIGGDEVQEAPPQESKADAKGKKK
jgi:hypothetical protein